MLHSGFVSEHSIPLARLVEPVDHGRNLSVRLKLQQSVPAKSVVVPLPARTLP